MWPPYPLVQLHSATRHAEVPCAARGWHVATSLQLAYPDNSSLFVTKKGPTAYPGKWNVSKYPTPIPRHWCCALLLPSVTVAFARPTPDPFLARSLPVAAGAGSQAQSRMLGGARSVTLGLSRPFQAALWGRGGGGGQLAAGRPRFFARVGSASLSNRNIHRSSRPCSRSTRPPLRVAAARPLSRLCSSFLCRAFCLARAPRLFTAF